MPFNKKIKMNNKIDNSFSTSSSDNLGNFDHALRSGSMSDILPKHGNGFTFTAPYGIVSVKPTSEAIEKLIALMKTFNVFEKDNESILDCWVNRKELEAGGNVKWESGRYTSRAEDKITLEEWIDESKVVPINKMQQKRKEIENTLEHVNHGI